MTGGDTAISSGSAPSPREPGGAARASSGNSEIAASEGRPRLSWPLRGLLAASLAVPLLLLVVVAWQNYRLVRSQAEERVTSTTSELHEHALKVIDTYRLALAWVDDRTRGLNWDRIEHDEALHQFLSKLEDLPEIDAIWMIDPNGRIRASGRFFPVPPADVSGRRYFRVQKRPTAGLYIGREHIGVLTGLPEFDVSRTRSSADGGFDGVIALAARPGYFSEFYGTVSHEKGLVAMLLRQDGSLLARYPEIATPGVPKKFREAIAARPQEGVFESAGGADGVERIYGYQKIDAYPAYVLFGIPIDGVLAQWRANLINYSLFALPASLALFLMTLFAVRQLQSHQLASWRWRNAAQELKREMDRRELAEEELRQSQKIEALGQLTGGVAHDFNNLLAVLQAALEMLAGRQRDERLEAKVSLALRTIERGEKLTSQLLAFARRQPLEIESIDLNALLRGMSELLVRTVGRGITIETDLAADLWPVDADANQLELAVINLAINARDAMPEGGTLRIRTFNETNPQALPDALQASETDGDFVALEIADTGTGIPPDVLARVFEPFFTTKQPGRGTGLGLSMVYGFARQSRGTVSIRSKPGEGTAVALHLPRSGGAVADHAAETDVADEDPAPQNGAMGLPGGGPA